MAATKRQKAALRRPRQKPNTAHKTAPKQHVPDDAAAKMSFLDLMPELRNRIYELLFETSEYVRIDAAGPFAGHPRLQAAALFRVNRQIHHEAVSYFYDCCVFDFYRVAPYWDWKGTREQDIFRGFLEIIGGSIVFLRHVVLPRMTRRVVSSVLHGLKLATDLKDLEIDYETWSAISAADMARVWPP